MSDVAAPLVPGTTETPTVTDERVEPMRPTALRAAPEPVAAVQPLGIDALSDVELEIVAVLGRARMTIGELRSTRLRTTITLDRPLHSPLDIMVNGKLFAHGELVAVDDSELGVRVTEIVADRTLGASA
jgi:flagellar motor switch protein FliN/FliY